MSALLRVLLWLGASMSALGEEMRIKSTDEFIQFKDNVKGGTNYEGTTVFLDSDLSLAGKTFEPIGTESNHFLGTFDGQGHVISNLAMTSSSLQFAGLFGYSKGLTIKNVILDSSCSITSSFRGTLWAHIGGIIGYCCTDKGLCTIENSVNMGSVTFKGGSSSYGYALYLGGIAGSFLIGHYASIVKNCANYADLTNSGKSSYSYIGGVTGYSADRLRIYNCLNHGTITNSGTTSNNLYFGGITGYTWGTTIENCVSGGKISSSSTTTPSSDNCIGSIVGGVDSGTSISYTYYTSKLSEYEKYGCGTLQSGSNTLRYDSTSFELSRSVSIGSYTGTSLIDALNAAADYYKDRDYSHWLLDKKRNFVRFTINGRSTFTMNYQVILLPSLTSEGDMSFDGWYTDEGLTTPLTNYDVTSETRLYGKYFCPNFTVTLDVNGGDELAVKKMSIGCDRVYGDLPKATRTGHTFLGWFTASSGGDKVESGSKVTTNSDHTIYAHWSINQYTLTFIFGNGDEPEVRVLDFNEAITYPEEPVRVGYSFDGWDRKIKNMPAENTNITAQWTSNKYTVTFNPSGGSVSQLTKVVTFGSAYGELPTPSRTGYTFIGWFNEKNESITAESIVKTPGNHTLYAHWSINKYTLTFIFGNETEPEVRVLEFNETITYPTDPVRAGYSFAGWDRNIKNMPSDNTTITAQWRANNYTVTFNPNGGSVSQSTKVVTFGSAYGDLPTPNRTGHTFLGWFNEKNESITAESIVEIPDNHILYAHWSINKYTLTFDFGNGDDSEVRVLDYNSPIVYPENPVREGFTFSGWDSNITYMPAYDRIIKALWTASSSGGKASNASFIVKIVVPVFVVIIAIFVVVVLVLYSRMKKKVERKSNEGRSELSEPLIDADSYCRVIALTKDEVEGNVPKKSTQSILTHLYPKDYTRPTMKEALTEADLTEKQVKNIFSACETAAQNIAGEGRLLEGFTEEDAAAVAMYTYDFGSKDFESNPYRIINRSLVGRNFAEMQRASGLLYLVMSALRKLPRVTGRTLYRGVRGEVNLDKDHYHKGNVVTWPALSSTSPDMEATKAFLAKGSKSGKETGTLFIIDKGWGYDIQPYSLFPDEEEILLEPERQFRVVSVLKAALTIINLEMLDTLLSVPEVFGGANE